MFRRPIVALALGAALLIAQEKPESKKETIVVTGSYRPIPLEEADRSIFALPIQPIEPLAANIGDVLNLDSSLDLRERAPGAVSGGLSIRGGGFGQTLVLWNGLRLNDVQTSNLNLDIPVPLPAVSQVEVLKGSGSTLYGSDATAGVLNVITSAPEASELRLRTGFGNWGTQQQEAVAAIVTHNLAQQFTFARDFNTGFEQNRDARNLFLVSETFLRTALGSTVVSLAHNDRPFGAQGFYGNYNSWERTKTYFASLRQSLGANTEASFAFRRHTDLFVLYRDRPQVYTNRHAVEGYQYAIRRHQDFNPGGRLHYGAEGLRDEIDSNNLGHHQRSRGSAFAAYDIRALRRFSFTAGAREEFYGRQQHQFSPSVGAGVWLSSWIKARGSVSRAFRLPTYTDLYYKDPANQGNPNLRPERAWSYEGGLDWNTRGKLHGDVTVFERRESDGIDYVRSSTTDIWRATNFQHLNFTGVETSVETVVARRHRIGLGYTALHGAQDSLGGQQSKYIFNYPRHSGLATWQAAFNNGLVARARVGALERLGRDPYAVFDLYGSWQRGRIRPYLQLTNLTDTFYQEFAGVNMPGRGVVGGVEWILWKRR